MYNRHLHEQQQHKLNTLLKQSQSCTRLQTRRSTAKQQMSQNYKQRVRDFLVAVTSKPVVLGKYQPPLVHIVRNPEAEKIMADARMCINGFRTSRDRLASVVESNKVLDLSPVGGQAKLHHYRTRDMAAEIQPSMRFRSLSSKHLKLPGVGNPREKLRFKALEELGNDLKTMRQSQIQQIGLVSKLQTVAGGLQLSHRDFSMRALRQSRLICPKVQLTH